MTSWKDSEMFIFATFYKVLREIRKFPDFLQFWALERKILRKWKYSRLKFSLQSQMATSRIEMKKMYSAPVFLAITINALPFAVSGFQRISLAYLNADRSKVSEYIRVFLWGASSSSHQPVWVPFLEAISELFFSRCAARSAKAALRAAFLKLIKLF